MGQNPLGETEDNPNLHENRFYMLCDVIFRLLGPHSLTEVKWEVMTITGNCTKPGFLVVKIVLESKHIVVVVVLKKSANRMPDAMDNVVQEPVAYIVYGIAGVGPSWTALKMDKVCSPQPTTLAP